MYNFEYYLNESLEQELQEGVVDFLKKSGQLFFKNNGDKSFVEFITKIEKFANEQAKEIATKDLDNDGESYYTKALRDTLYDSLSDKMAKDGIVKSMGNSRRIILSINVKFWSNFDATFPINKSTDFEKVKQYFGLEEYGKGSGNWRKKITKNVTIDLDKSNVKISF